MGAELTIQKMVERVIEVQDIIVDKVRAKRGAQFHIDDWLPIIEFKRRFEPMNGESPEAMELFKKCAEAHYGTIKSLTDTIRPEDEPWTENFQVPVVLGILYELDSKFKRA